LVSPPKIVVAQRVEVELVPPQVQILLKPGVSLLKAFNFKNLGDPGVFSFHLVSFKPRGDEGGVEFLEKAEGPIRFSLENADKQLGQKFFLDSRSTVQALLRVRAIDNAPEGDYYYTLFLVSEPSINQSTASRSSAMVGANILISVTNTGLTPSSIKVAQLQIIPRYRLRLFGKTFLIVEPNDEVPVVLKLANTGRFLVTPKAKIRVKGPFGVNQTKKMLGLNILAGSQRLLTKQQPDECQRCQTKPSAVFKGFYFGKYQLSAEIAFFNVNQKLFAETEFWALPVRLSITVLALFLLSFMLLFFLKKKHYE